MFDSLFKKKKKEGLDSVVDSKEIVGDQDDDKGKSEQNEQGEVYPKLYFPPSLKIDNEQRYVLSYLNNELPPLKPNQLSLSGIEIYSYSKQLIVTAFVRSSLPRSVKLGKMPLVLLDKNKEVIAKNVFDGKKLGEIPAESTIPWHFIFPKETIVKQEFEKEGWTLAFQLTNTKHRLDLDENWEKALSEEKKENLRKIVESLPPLKKNELNLTGLQAKVHDNGDLHVTVLIRSGLEKNVQIEKLPLQVLDAEGDVLAEGGFTLNNFELKANTTKPWTFVFPHSLLKKDIVNLSKWSVKIK